MPILAEKTFELFGYPLSSVTPGMDKYVAVKCEACPTEFTIRRKNLKPEMLCKPCKYKTIPRENYAKGVKQRKATCLEKYGTESKPFEESTHIKRRETNFKKYGGPAPQSNQAVRQKTRETCLLKYGQPFAVATPAARKKSERTLLERYGVPHSFLSSIVRNKVINTLQNRYGVTNPSQSAEFRAKAAKTTIERFGTLNHQNYGKAEEVVAKFIEELGLTVTRQYQIPGTAKSIDIYIENLKIGIEYCGLYWHCENFVPRHQHRLKMDIAESNGIRLITLFEDEWLFRTDAVKGVLKSILNTGTQTIGARECIVQDLHPAQAESFLVNHHIQGAHSGIRVAFGLFNKQQELLGVLTLKHDHRPKTSDAIVLQRLCFKHGIHVAGGASKLFAAAKLWAINKQYSRIISWSDNRWFKGKVYEKLNFTCVYENKTDYAYVDLKKHLRLSKQTQQKQKTNCPTELTELEWATQRGLARIWDCGHKRWELKL